MSIENVTPFGVRFTRSHHRRNRARNQRNALDGAAAAPIRPYRLTQAFGGARTLSIRRGRWKYLDHQGSGGNNYTAAALKPFAVSETAPDAPGQLYDLAQDPGEVTNLYFKLPEVASELKTLLEESKPSGRSRP